MSTRSQLGLLIALVTIAACSSSGDAPRAGKQARTTREDPVVVAPPAQASALTLERVASLPKPGTVIPKTLAFTGDGEHVSFLFSETKSLSRNLYVQNLKTGVRRQLLKDLESGDTEENLSEAEKLERERRRERGLGVTKYSWSKKGDTLLVPLGGALHTQRGIEGEVHTIRDRQDKPALSPRLSRDGTMLAYVHDAEIYVMPSDGSKVPRQITKGARGTGSVHGLAEYIAQEEMERYAGYWWSLDGKSIAFTEVDETHIPEYRIVHQGKAAVGEAAQEDHGYPFAGAANARVRLGVVPIQGGKTVWMDMGENRDFYLARVHWMPNGELWAEVENREQTTLELVRFDPSTGAQTSVLKESSDVWINLHSHFRALKNSGDAAFLWASERTGFMHLYLYGSDGKLLRSLTSGEWPVDSVAGVDEEARKVYFLSGKGDPTQKQLYEVSLDGGEPRRITSDSGTHSVRFDKTYARFIDTHSSMRAPPTVRVRNVSDGKVIATIFDTQDPEVEELGLIPPKLVTIESRDGTTLHGAIYEPRAPFTAPYPVVISVYGGPHVQRVSDTWRMTSDLGAQHLRDQGVLVFKLDNRGSGRRGLKFEGAIRHDLGNIEVSDQVDGVHWLVSQGLADSGRVGITGWSYGGYLAAMALARVPETFHVAVAGAPVTHWDGYDTHYTERYMGTPRSNPKGYEESSIMHHVAAMQGSLLLVHGLIDENVHFRHTARLIDALIKAQKNYDLLLFPNERHSPRDKDDRLYMEKRIFEYLHDALGLGR
ncbi:MAG: S9 family peptidase [Myxococcales bacterium]|nr:S9 family peptidase [Myxococcales bacterium]